MGGGVAGFVFWCPDFGYTWPALHAADIPALHTQFPGDLAQLGRRQKDASKRSRTGRMAASAQGVSSSAITRNCSPSGFEPVIAEAFPGEQSAIFPTTRLAIT